MEPAGFTELPVEVIHHISRYLPLQDVLSCSLTCHFLRDALNYNCVWKRHLPQGISSLQTQEQQVSPALILDEGLSPLCENRLHFIRKTHLLNNWNTGNCIKFKSTSEYRYTVRDFKCTKGIENVIYDDKYLFISRFLDNFENHESDGIEVWEISKVPFLYTTLKVSEVNYDCFFVIGSYLVVVKYVNVYVYRINLPEKEFPYVCSFRIADNNVVYNQHVEHYERSTTNQDSDHATFKNYLISNKFGESLLHIWDIHKLSKIGSFQPITECHRIILHSYIGNNLWYEIVDSSSIKYLSAFDIDTFKFTEYNNFTYSVHDYSYILPFDTYVIVFIYADYFNEEGLWDTFGTVFELNTSSKLKERCFHHHYDSCLSITPIVNGRFVFLCGDGFHVVNALTLETVEKILCNDIHDVHQCMFLFDSLLVVGINSIGNIELFDINKKKKLSVNLNEYASRLYLDKKCTKLVTVKSGSISVLHFW